MRDSVYVAALFVCFHAATAAAPQDAAPVDAPQVLRELESLVRLRDQQAGRNRSSRQSALEEAARGGSASAETYKKAVQALHTGSNADFADWSRDNADLLRSEGMQQAIMFHARYLLLGMKARVALSKPDVEAGAETARQCLAYVRQLSAFMNARDDSAKTPREARQLLEKPVQDGVFTRWLGLMDYLPGKENWEEKPGNLESILEKNVRAPLRKVKDVTVLGAWDVQIELLRARAEQASDAAAAGIKETELPRAIYGRASDKKLLGLHNAFVRDTLALAKQHPGHPDWDKWTQSLRDALSSRPPAHDQGAPGQPISE